MRVLVLYAHPDPESFASSLHRTVVETLVAAGHEVDDCDLYAEGFNPVLSREERAGYHDTDTNQKPVADYVARLQRAEALVLSYPVWNFGFPAMLKGFFDRVFLPGVSFKLVDGTVRPALWNIRKLAAVATYGGARSRAFLMGDPPRKVVTRVVRAVCHPAARPLYLTHYDMNRSTDATRAAFIADVRARLSSW